MNPFGVKKKVDWYHWGYLKCPPLELGGTFFSSDFIPDVPFSNLR